MGRQTKTIVRMYSAWNYQQETEDLNRLSEQGWQLRHGGCFASRFVKNDRLRYVYQLDYQPRLTELGRYLETYREQGWEYVNCTFNGWYYFRKVYDPALPPQEYEIFTDRASLQEMNGRWAKLALGMIIALGIMSVLELIFCLRYPDIPGFVLLAALLADLFMFLHGYRIMKDPERSKTDRRDSLRLTLVLAVLLIGCLGSVTLRTLRPNGTTHMHADSYEPIAAGVDDGMILNRFTVRYKDYYYLDLEVEADTDVTVSITDGGEKTVFEKTGREYELDDARLRLLPGEYQIILSDFSGGALDVEYDLD